AGPVHRPETRRPPGTSASPPRYGASRPGAATRTRVAAYTAPGAAPASVRNISAFQQAGHVRATGKVSVPQRGQRVARSSARPSGSSRQESGSSRRAGGPEAGSAIGAEDVEGVPAQRRVLVFGFQPAQPAAAHPV